MALQVPAALQGLRVPHRIERGLRLHRDDPSHAETTRIALFRHSLREFCGAVSGARTETRRFSAAPVHNVSNQRARNERRDHVSCYANPLMGYGFASAQAKTPGTLAPGVSR